MNANYGAWLNKKTNNDAPGMQRRGASNGAITGIFYSEDLETIPITVNKETDIDPGLKKLAKKRKKERLIGSRNAIDTKHYHKKFHYIPIVP